MPLSLDHVFICPENPKLAERVLADFGLQFSHRGIHRGQGTANTCAFFDNAYLELLWRDNDEELQSEVVSPVGLWQRVRWRETGASPFGVSFRSDDGDVPVDTWAYDAPFLPVGATIPVVTPRFRWREPMTFISPMSQAPIEMPVEQKLVLTHRGMHHRMTSVLIHSPEATEISAGLAELCGRGIIELKPAAEHCIDLEWDGAECGESYDFRPTLPLVLRW
jgi:hypothetical protein